MASLVTSNPAQFEQEVRRIAREVFPQSGGYGPVNLEGRERDGVLNDGETIHIIEATCNPTKEKAIHDLAKSIDLKRELSKVFPDHNFKIWLITERDPTAHQMDEVVAAKRKARYPVVASSINAFSQKLVNAPAYLAVRENYHFGSVRELSSTGQQKNAVKNHFVPLDLIEIGNHQQVSTSALASIMINSKGNNLLLGDYGAGKSMTMRHIYQVCKGRFHDGKSTTFPVFLNLRDHVGQDDPSSALFDHGRKIGFAEPQRLVGAWRAGFVHLFLDGFDEIVSSRFRANSGGLKSVRRRAMTLIRKFVEDHPYLEAGLLVSGREDYFGNPTERTDALGFTNKGLRTFTLNEFTLDQTKEYLRKMGIQSHMIPEWLPTRPLLVGYLAVRGVEHLTWGNLGRMPRAEGWDYLLNQICQREGQQIEALGGQIEQVRPFIDRLATKARASFTGRGPVLARDMTEIFRAVFPSSADESAEQLLVRMAGLATASNSGDGLVVTSADQEDAREFIDEDLVDAARAGDVARYIEYSHDEDLNRLFIDVNASVTMGDLGIQVAVHKLEPFSNGKAIAALRHAADILSAPTLAFDIVRIIQFMGFDIANTREVIKTVLVRDGYFNFFEVSSGYDLPFVTFTNCIISNLQIVRDGRLIKGPHFESCIIENVTGALSRDDLPIGLVDSKTEIESFRFETETNTQIRQQNLLASVKVLLTCLNRLFTQGGGTRKDSAFNRGIDDVERAYVADVMQLISFHDFAHKQKVGGPFIWISNRAKKAEATEILRAPQESMHPLIVQVREF